MRELVATLAGVIVGWIFNEITMFFRERPKLTFKMVSTLKQVYQNMELKFIIQVKIHLY